MSKTVEQLAQDDQLTGEEKIYVSDNGADKNISVEQIKDFVFENIPAPQQSNPVYTNLGGYIDGAVYSAATHHWRATVDADGYVNINSRLVTNRSYILNTVCNGYKVNVESVTQDEGDPTLFIVRLKVEGAVEGTTVLVTAFTGGYNAQ